MGENEEEIKLTAAELRTAPDQLDEYETWLLLVAKLPRAPSLT